MMGNKRKIKKNRIQLVLFGIVSAGVLAVGLWQFTLIMPNLPTPPLKDLARQQGVELGVLANPDRIDDRVYPDLISSQFGFVTIDGGIHFADVQPEQGKYDFSKADRVVDFAEKNSMPVQLHHLIWGDDSRLPGWLTEDDFTKQELEDIQRDHIETIVKRYKGRVQEYTVSNEAFTENQHVYGLTDWWADKTGNNLEHIDKYFRWAHEADPAAVLILNDFNNETKNSVSDAMYEYIKGAKARGVPVGGIGMQMHIDASRPPQKQQVIDNMNRFGDLGLPVYVTEFDIDTNAVDGDTEYKQQLESRLMHDMTRACIESETCVSFTVFGVTRKNDFLKMIGRTNSRDYMFDSRYQPRPSFYAFREAWLEP